MHGHVWEWCLDEYFSYPKEKSLNYVRLGPESGEKTFRGGCWRSDQASVRSAVRGHFKVSYRIDRVGFRPIARLDKNFGGELIGEGF